MKKIYTNHSTFILKFVLLICIQQVSLICVAQKVSVKQLKIGKAGENVFASDFFNSTIYFCADRKNKSNKTVENEYNQNFLDLYSVGFDTETMHLTEIVKLDSNVNSLLNEGPIDINEQSGIGYFSSNRVDSLTSELYLTLFQSRLDQNNKFESKEEIFKDLKGYNIAHPTISSDGKMLVFSSDNPESKGQTDLYMSILNNSQWTSPIAISNVNTVAVETFPHFYGDVLYFASDREGSFGGLDVYKCIFRNDQFSEPEHLESPVNSEFDDFLYVPINETFGLFSSNRNGSKDKIFTYKIDLPQPSDFIEVNDNFCFMLADEGQVDSLRFKHTWSTGDGELITGQSVSYCYKDTGTFQVSCDLLDSKTGQIDVGFIFTEIIIDINTPTIQAEISDNVLQLSIDHKYSEIVYTDFYWIVEDKIYTETSPVIPFKSRQIEIKLIVWEKKKAENAVGIIKKITVNP